MYDKDNDIEKLLLYDIIEKKKSGRGVYNRASRKGFIRGGVRTQSDYLTAKEKKLLNGEIKVSNMYESVDNIPTLDELLKKDDNAIKFILTTIKANHSTKVMAKKLGTSIGKLYSLFNKYNVEYFKKPKLITDNSVEISTESQSLMVPVSEMTNETKPGEVKETKKKPNKLKNNKEAFKKMSIIEKNRFLSNCIIDGFSTGDIAKSIGLKAQTVSSYYKKFGVDVISLKNGKSLEMKNKETESVKTEVVKPVQVISEEVSLINTISHDKIEQLSVSDINHSDTTSVLNSEQGFENVFNTASIQRPADDNLRILMDQVDSLSKQLEETLNKYNELEESSSSKNNAAIEILNKQCAEIDSYKSTIDELTNKLDATSNRQGISLSLNGKFTGDELETRLLSLIGVTLKDQNYNIKFTINEA